MLKKILILLTVSVVFTSCAIFKGKKEKLDLESFASQWVEEQMKPVLFPAQNRNLVYLDSLILSPNTDTLILDFSQRTKRMYYREDQVLKLDSMALNHFSAYLPSVKEVVLRADNHELPYYIPNAYRSIIAPDSSRFAKDIRKGENRVVVPLHAPQKDFKKGLGGRNIALWQSHGWYYEKADDRWKWQRARLYQTVEDLFPTRFILNYLTPMLERAGAQVWMPRERGLLTDEVWIDDPNFYAFSSDQAPIVLDEGFALGDSLIRDNQNPFEMGTSLKIDPDIHGNDASIVFHATMNQTGRHPLYIAFPKLDEASNDVRLEVHYGDSRYVYRIDQSKGYRTWVHVDDFYFEADSLIKMKLFSAGQSKKNWGWDAFRIGGGVGNVVRGGRTSNRPRYVEGSRYWLQYAGFPDSLVYDFRPEERDYTDDYVSRGEWVNFLQGPPGGANENRSVPGMNIPVDLSLAFHTDAGFDTTKTIGTLLIYSSVDALGADTLYDGSNRITNRDLSDITQTEIVDRIRNEWMPDWQRRGMWDSRYSEAFRPNVPAMLLELLSHHNELDMRLGLDPNFRFDASRAIYAGILKYLASRHHFEYQLQPLPPKEISVLPSVWRDSVTVQWKEEIDLLEPKSKASSYLVEASTHEMGNFQLIAQSENTHITLPKAMLSKYRVIRIVGKNEGGLSMPSRVSAMSFPEKFAKNILMVDSFDRVEGPSKTYTGNHVIFNDFGITEGLDPGLIGDVRNTDIADVWRGDGYTNDEPGFGASFSNLEGHPVAGNTGSHVRALAEDFFHLGHQVYTVSQSVFEQMSKKELSLYDVIMINAGAQKTGKKPPSYTDDQFSLFNSAFVSKLEDIQSLAKQIVISSAYLGHELSAIKNDSLLYARTNTLLGVEPIAIHAIKIPLIHTNTKQGAQNALHFQNQPNRFTYHIPEVDAINFTTSARINNQEEVLYRFTENDMPAILRQQTKQSSLTISTVPLDLILDVNRRRNLLKHLIQN